MRREGPVLLLVRQFSKSTHSSSLIGQLWSAALGSFNILTRHQPFYSFQQRSCGKWHICSHIVSLFKELSLMWIGETNVVLLWLVMSFVTWMLRYLSHCAIAHCREASEVPLNTISRLQPSALPISDITDRNALLRPLQAGWQWQAPHGDADQGYQGAPPVSIQFEQASSIRLLSFKF